MDACKYVQSKLIHSVWKYLEKALGPYLTGGVLRAQNLTMIIGRGTMYYKTNTVHAERITVVQHFREIVSVFRKLCLQNAV